MRPVTTKLLSLFVVAFLCLNAAAYVCLAHCNAVASMASTPMAAAEDTSLPPCHRKRMSTSGRKHNSLGSNAITCCMLPVGVFAAPLEKRTDTPAAIVAAAVMPVQEFAPDLVSQSRQIPKFYYRPPPNDARYDRVRNQVFRI